jgi:hypothetical protein
MRKTLAVGPYHITSEFHSGTESAPQIILILNTGDKQQITNYYLQLRKNNIGHIHILVGKSLLDQLYDTGCTDDYCEKRVTIDAIHAYAISANIKRHSIIYISAPYYPYLSDFQTLFADVRKIS